MKYVRIIKQTFLKGVLVKVGEEYKVDDRTAVMLGSKAVVIDKPGGSEKPVEDGPMEAMPVIKQEEVVVEPEIVKERLNKPKYGKGGKKR